MVSDVKNHSGRVMSKYYSPLANVIVYQGIWFATVLGGQQYIVVPCLLLVLHLYLSTGRREEMMVMGACASIGLLADVLLSLFGFYEFTAPPVVIAVPFWLVILWLGFAGTLRLALAFLIKRPLLAIVAGALGAPLSYLAAGRLGAVSFPYGLVKTALILVMVWMILMCLFVIIVRTVEATAKKRANDAT